MTAPLLLLALVQAAGCYSGADAQLSPGDGAVVQPRSLAGTEIDGALRSERGDFVFDEAARRAFDYFLTADEELEPAALDAWVRAELARRVPDAVDGATAAWRAYVEYRGAAAATLTDPEVALEVLDVLDGAEERLVRLVDEHLADYPIAAQERAEVTRGFALRRATALTGEAREQALAGLAAEPALAGEAEAFLTGRRAVALASLAGAGPQEVHAVRTQHFGADAAARLAALDARRAAWDARIAAFTEARAGLLAEFAGTPAQRDAAVASLAATHFSASELRRVHALVP